MTKTERLERAGQLRLPNIDVMVDRFFMGVVVITQKAAEAIEAAVEVVKEAVEAVPVVRHLAAVIKATRTTISARVAGALLVLGGDQRGDYSQDTAEAQAAVEDLVANLNEDDTYATLFGLGFEERPYGHLAH